jgi:FkbM family methyltransferase
MIQIGGVFLPDGEKHLVEWMKTKNQVVDGKLAYQYHKLEAALAHVKQWRTAIDVGAHCGLWSMHLAKRFARLDAFEPVEAHRACWDANLVSELEASRIRGCAIFMHPFALGEKDGSVRMETAPTSSGDTRIAGDGDIPLRRLDDVLAGREDVDFIKLDCEGYELFALRGGEQLLKRCRPCVIVEQKPGRGQRFGLTEQGAVDYLKSLGAKLRREMSGDFILSWDNLEEKSK